MHVIITLCAIVCRFSGYTFSIFRNTTCIVFNAATNAGCFMSQFTLGNSDPLAFLVAVAVSKGNIEGTASFLSDL